MSKKAQKHQAINLSQGFPDFNPPEWLLKIKQEVATRPEYQQYAQGIGQAALRKNLESTYSRLYDLKYCAEKEISITSGATEAIFASLMSLLNPGDEVIIFEPYYDSYRASIELAGGKPVYVTLHAPEFNFKVEELEQAITPNTKAIILNSPHNPSGKVFNQDELLTISKLAQRNDLYVISDEVYEHLTFDETKHIPIATLPGMFERTMTISSAGKTFGATGWKVGWTCAPENLSHGIRMVHQFVTFSVHHASQVAVAQALTQLEQYIPSFKKEYQSKRDYFLEALEKIDFKCYRPQGTYFILADISNKTQLKDIGYSLELIETKAVATIPPSVFYSNSTDGEKYLRFCFAKKDETLSAAIKNLS